MRVIRDFGLVRVVSLGDPFNNSSDIQVQSRLSLESPWTKVAGFNSLSDDYAYTNALEAAGRAVAIVAAHHAHSVPGESHV